MEPAQRATATTNCHATAISATSQSIDSVTRPYAYSSASKGPSPAQMPANPSLSASVDFGPVPSLIPVHPSAKSRVEQIGRIPVQNARLCISCISWIRPDARSSSMYHIKVAVLHALGQLAIQIKPSSEPDTTVKHQPPHSIQLNRNQQTFNKTTESSHQ